jgi:hypothetical protein
VRANYRPRPRPLGTDTARDALAHGIGWVTLYGAVSAWSLALMSFLVFGGKKAMQAEALSR